MYLKLTAKNQFVKKSVAQNVLRGLKSLSSWANSQVIKQEQEVQELVDSGAAEETAPVGLSTRLDRALQRLAERELFRDQLKSDFNDGVESYVNEFKEQPQLEYVQAIVEGAKMDRKTQLARFVKTS